MSQYLSVNDILVSNEKVPCTFLSTLPRLGFLVSSTECEDVEAGAHVELSLWLAEALSARRAPPLVSVGLPRVYREAYRDILLADACTVNLHKLGRYFYELGCYVAKNDIRGDVGSTLVSTFRQRYRLVAEAAVCGADGGDGSLESSRLLAEGERRRAAEAAAAARALADWLRRGACVLRTADMVASHRKRKRHEMEML